MSGAEVEVGQPSVLSAHSEEGKEEEEGGSSDEQGLALSSAQPVVPLLQPYYTRRGSWGGPRSAQGGANIGAVAAGCRDQ